MPPAPSLRWSLPLAVLAAFLLATAVSLLFADRAYRERLLTDMEQHLRDEAARLIRQAQVDLVRDPGRIEREIMLHGAHEGEVLTALIDPQWRILYASRAEWKNRLATDALPQWNAARLQRVTAGLEAALLRDGLAMSLVMPYEHPPASGEIASLRRGLLAVEYDLGEIVAAERRQMLYARLPELGVMLLFAALLAYGLHRRIVRPVARLAASMQLLARGDLDTRAESSGSGELAELGRHFNRMAAALQEARVREIELTYTDPLTGLPNRTLFMDRLKQTLENARRDGHFAAVLVINLDRFKDVNDARGLDAGDRLLRLAAARMQELLGAGDTLARLTADEFAVLLPRLFSDAHAAARQTLALAERLNAALAEPFEMGDESLNKRASIGIALLPLHREDGATDVLMNADTALHRAKQEGGDRAVFFESDMGETVRARFRIEHELRHALAEDQLLLYLQPQVDPRGAMIGFEALVRWQHPERGLVPPGVFIPVAEDAGLVADIDRWVLNRVCALLAHLGTHRTTPLRFSINISPSHFGRPDFVARIRHSLAHHDVDPSRLMLEVTEGLLIEDTGTAVARMTELAALGIRFSVDDFGTGYSSLAYLKRLPIHELKIDQSFIHDTPDDPNDTALVESILAIAGHLGLAVVAEGVETQAQAAFLRLRGEVIQQGYLHGRPEPAAAWIARLHESGDTP